MNIPERWATDHRIFSTSKSARPAAENYVQAIDEIAILTAENADLREQVERLSAPITKQEWQDEAGFDDDLTFYLPKKSFNRIIKSRLIAPSKEKV